MKAKNEDKSEQHILNDKNFANQNKQSQKYYFEKIKL